MLHTEAHQIVVKLANRFGVPVPTIRLMAGRGSCASPSRNEIRLGSGHIGKTASREDVLLHEFAHILDYRMGTYDSADPHGPSFYTALKRIVKFHFGDLKLYDWSQDYFRVYSFAKKEGLTDKEHYGSTIRRERTARRPQVHVANVGDTVSFECRGKVIVGKVFKANRGVRACVKEATQTTRFWRVPQSILKVVS